MATDLTYPIAEIFTSIQGEGRWSGTVMRFIRFAGCTVGKPYTYEARKSLELPMYIERCTSWNGTGFSCDTNYRKTETRTLEGLLDEAKGHKRICLTGGEPLMHKVTPLIHALLAAGHLVHIETSGTIEAVVGCGWMNKPNVWVAVSPKAKYHVSMLYAANEIKVLVGDDFDRGVFLARFGNLLDKICLQPVNGEFTINDDNLQRCIALVHEFPQMTLSSQLHKAWKIR